MKIQALMLLILLAGCAIPVEEHGGIAPRPAAPDLVFIGGAAALDGGLQLVKVPAVPRLAIDALAAWVVRVPKFAGRTEAAHLLVFAGAFSTEWLGIIFRGHP